MNSRLNDWGEAIAIAHKAGELKPVVDPSITIEDAYRIQNEVVTRLGGRVLGFKSALSSTQAQKAFGVAEPVFGVLPDVSKVGSGFSLEEMAMPMIEIEMGFELGASLSGPLTSVDFNQVIRTSVMAIDIADVGFTGKPGGCDLITSNAAGGRFLRGDDFQCNDPNAVSVALKRDGETINTAKSGDIGDQRDLAVWIINRALSLGYEVTSGMLIMTGALGQILPAKAGDYTAEYEGFGSLQIRLN